MGLIMHREQRERGASLIEFAIILPLLLVVLFGIVEFGFILYDKVMITNAAREGARYGILARSPRYTEVEIQNRVSSYCTTNLISFGGAASPQVNVTFPATLIFGENLVVNVTYQYRFLFVPNFVPGLPQSLNLSSTAVMKYE